jgi:peptidoglycan/LPS O-acetylase OafA/YrhL
MIAQHIAAGTSRGTAKRFYRPELDALRFFAFLAVLVRHGAGPSLGLLGVVRDTGNFGLSMFFLLSASLITELLLREREQSGTVAWGFFFTRRALRIWPLYYASLVAGAVIGKLSPDSFGTTRAGVIAASFFVANWPINRYLGIIIGPLWSISVEEQFYLIWPPIIKFGGKTLALAASISFAVVAGVWLWSYSGKGWKLWFDTPVEFLFFAAGTMIAFATRGRSLPVMSGILRGGGIVAGLFSLVIAALVGGIAEPGPGITIDRLYIGYSAAVVGCSTIFLATLGMSNIPRSLIYLGKISYGLYVFHAGILELSKWLTTPLHLASGSALEMFVVDGLALVLCILAAHLSYRYFETPFLRLKSRFEIVKSRPV